MSKFIFFKSSSSIFNNSLSHPASSANLLSAIIYARFCSSVKFSINKQGTSFIPSFFAPNILPCPAITFRSPSTNTGLINPNSFMDLAIFSICSSECVLALFLYGFNFSISTFSYLLIILPSFISKNCVKLKIKNCYKSILSCFIFQKIHGKFFLVCFVGSGGVDFSISFFSIFGRGDQFLRLNFHFFEIDFFCS